MVWVFRVWGSVCFLGCGAEVFVRYLYFVECVILMRKWMVVNVAVER